MRRRRHVIIVLLLHTPTKQSNGILTILPFEPRPQEPKKGSRGALSTV